METSTSETTTPAQETQPKSILKPSNGDLRTPSSPLFDSQETSQSCSTVVPSTPSYTGLSDSDRSPPPTPPKTKKEKARALARRKAQINQWRKLKEREEREERIRKRLRIVEMESIRQTRSSSKLKWGTTVEVENEFDQSELDTIAKKDDD
jgi:hypothetical protein